MVEDVSDEQIARIHPLALALIDILGEGRDEPKGITIEPELLEELTVELRELYGTEELVHAIVSLTELVASLEHHGNIEAAKDLAAVVDSEEMNQAMDELIKAKRAREGVDDGGDRVEDDGASQASRVTGGDKPKTAPKEGEEAPDGAVKIDKLDFPKRA